MPPVRVPCYFKRDRSSDRLRVLSGEILPAAKGFFSVYAAAKGTRRPAPDLYSLLAVQRYDVTLAGQDLSIKKKFNAVKWRIMCAFAKQNLNLNLSFVRRCELLDGDDSIVEVEKDFVWSYKFTIEVEMWWARSSF